LKKNVIFCKTCLSVNEYCLLIRFIFLWYLLFCKICYLIFTCISMMLLLFCKICCRSFIYILMMLLLFWEIYYLIFVCVLMMLLLFWEICCLIFACISSFVLVSLWFLLLKLMLCFHKINEFLLTKVFFINFIDWEQILNMLYHM